MGDPTDIDSGESWEDQRSSYDALRQLSLLITKSCVYRGNGEIVEVRKPEGVLEAVDAAVRVPFEFHHCAIP